MTVATLCTTEDNALHANYKAIAIDKTASAQKIIENELFGVNDVNSTMVISSSNAGNYSDYYFYKLDDENICLGIKSYNQLQNDAVIYINTQKECGTVCKVYLDEAQEKQIFYVWEHLKEISSNKTNEKLSVKTNRGTYTGVFLLFCIVLKKIFFSFFLVGLLLVIVLIEITEKKLLRI